MDLLVRMGPRIEGVRLQRSDSQDLDVQCALLLNHYSLPLVQDQLCWSRFELEFLHGHPTGSVNWINLSYMSSPRTDAIQVKKVNRPASFLILDKASKTTPIKTDLASKRPTYLMTPLSGPPLLDFWGVEPDWYFRSPRIRCELRQIRCLFRRDAGEARPSLSG